MRGSYRALGVVACLSIVTYAVQVLLFPNANTWYGVAATAGSREDVIRLLFTRVLLGQTDTWLAVAAAGIACLLAGQSRRWGWLVALVVASVVCAYVPACLTYAVDFGILGRGGYSDQLNASFYFVNNVLPYSFALLPVLALVFALTRRHIEPEAEEVISEQTLP